MPSRVPCNTPFTVDSVTTFYSDTDPLHSSSCERSNMHMAGFHKQKHASFAVLTGTKLH